MKNTQNVVIKFHILLLLSQKNAIIGILFVDNILSGVLYCYRESRVREYKNRVVAFVKNPWFSGRPHHPVLFTDSENIYKNAFIQQDNAKKINILI